MACACMCWNEFRLCLESCDFAIPVLDQGCGISDPLPVTAVSFLCSSSTDRHHHEERPSLWAFLCGVLSPLWLGIPYIMEKKIAMVRLKFVLNEHNWWNSYVQKGNAELLSPSLNFLIFYLFFHVRVSMPQELTLPKRIYRTWPPVPAFTSEHLSQCL